MNFIIHLLLLKIIPHLNLITPQLTGFYFIKQKLFLCD